MTRLQELIAQRKGGLVCTPDTIALWRAQNQPLARAIYEAADLVTPDGTGIIWASRMLGVALKERVSGIDLLEKLFAHSPSLRVFLLGAAPGVAEEAARRLQERFSLEIVGVQHGFFSTAETVDILEHIRSVQPDLLLVGMGAPRQESWMSRYRQNLPGIVLMGVGGCFDVWSGRLQRAPHGWRKLGLEWAYRLLQEPKRLARISAIPLFILEVSALKFWHLLWR